MPTITFIDPTKTNCSTTKKPQYDPVNRPWDFSGIPDKPGVYIWGMKVQVNGKGYFAPWYVGESIGLQGRLEEHYFGLFSRGSCNYGLYDFSQAAYSVDDIRTLYDSMRKYDSFVNKIGTKGGTHKLDAALNNVPKLIFWQDNRFLHHKSTGTYTDIPKYDIRDQSGIMPGGLLDDIGTTGAKDLKDRITKCKQNFDNGFYFLYWPWAKDRSFSIEVLTDILNPDLTDKQQKKARKAMENIPKAAIRAIEHATKRALYQVEIPTIAESYLEKDGNVGGYPAVTIDLPTQTDFVHDLWSPNGTRTVKVVGRPLR